jgi:hypothetical protein
MVPLAGSRKIPLTTLTVKCRGTERRARMATAYTEVPGNIFAAFVAEVCAGALRKPTCWQAGIPFLNSKRELRIHPFPLLGQCRPPQRTFDRGEDRVDLGNGLCVVRLQHPAFLVRVILIKEAQAYGVLPVGAAAAPGLKDPGLLDAGLLIQIVSIEDERFVLGVEHAPEGLLRIPALADVVDFGYVEVAGANQIPDVAVPVEQFPAFCDLLVLVLDRFIEIVDLTFQRERLLGVL